MTITGDYVIIFLALLSLGLTLIAIRVSLIVFRLAAAISWLSLGILFWTNVFTGISVGATWVQALSFLCLVMIIASLTLQMKSDIRHEEIVRGHQRGYPGASSESWRDWGPKPNQKKTQTSLDRQMSYKQLLKTKRQR